MEEPRRITLKSGTALALCKIKNPFNAPVYHALSVTSTMVISRELSSIGEPHGTVIASDFQMEGRGRIQGRKWQTEDKMSLPFTILLRYPKIQNDQAQDAQGIPRALTLKAGLAAAHAIEDFSVSLNGIVKIKWPNDIMINNKKIAGILCESDGMNVFLGIGINIRQKNFPPHLSDKASSIALASGIEITEDDRFLLLEKILARLYSELNDSDNPWKPRLEQRLYKQGQTVTFTEGRADSGKTIKGILRGIGDEGELLIACGGSQEIRAFVTGELNVT